MVDFLGSIVGPKVENPLEFFGPEGFDEFDEVVLRGIEVAKCQNQNQQMLKIAEVAFELGAGIKKPFAVRLEFPVDHSDGVFAFYLFRCFVAFLRLRPEELIFAAVKVALVVDRHLARANLILRKGLYKGIRDVRRRSKRSISDASNFAFVSAGVAGCILRPNFWWEIR